MNLLNLGELTTNWSPSNYLLLISRYLLEAEVVERSTATCFLRSLHGSFDIEINKATASYYYLINPYIAYTGESNNGCFAIVQM